MYVLKKQTGLSQNFREFPKNLFNKGYLNNYFRPKLLYLQRK